MNNINEIDEELEITPKGIALLSMLYCGLITDIDEPRFKGFWTLFENDMKESGYFIDDSGSNKIVKENTNTYELSESEKFLRGEKC